MTLNKQFINLLGILLAVVVVVAGLALIAMPMYSQAQTTDNETATVAQSNSVYQVQIDALSAANERIDDIDANLADLRVQIAATPKLDDVFEIVGAAAQQADVRIESITGGEIVAWVPRTALDAEGNPVTVAPEAPVTGDAATDGAATEGAATPAPAAPTTTETSPQQQVVLTITIDMAQPFAMPGADAAADDPPPAADAESVDPAAVRAAATAQAQKAAAFVDSLAVGPRLIAPTNVAYSGGKLTLSVLAFIRTEDAQ